MKLLALDTATENCSAALLISGRLIEREALLGRGQAEHILPMIAELLAQAGLKLRALDAIAFGRGPGAFTGVRLAASVTQGLAYGAGLPVVPVSDLRAVAERQLRAEPALERVLVCADARMHEVYTGAFVRGAAGLAEPFAAESVKAPEAVELPAQWSQRTPALPVAGVGTGFAAYPMLRERLGARLASVIPSLLPRAAEIAWLAAAELGAGHGLTAEQALPVYLRDDVARPAAPRDPTSH